MNLTSSVDFQERSSRQGLRAGQGVKPGGHGQTTGGEARGEITYKPKKKYFQTWTGVLCDKLQDFLIDNYIISCIILFFTCVEKFFF